jgi:hypothetical protein
MEPRGLYRERNGWAENEHSARVKYDEHQEFDISERLYRARDYQPPFDELPWLDEIATSQKRQRRAAQQRKPAHRRQTPPAGSHLDGDAAGSSAIAASIFRVRPPTDLTPSVLDQQDRKPSTRANIL